MSPKANKQVPVIGPEKPKNVAQTAIESVSNTLFATVREGDASALVKHQDVMVADANRAFVAGDDATRGASVLAIMFAFIFTRSDNHGRTLLLDWAAGNAKGADKALADAADENLRLWVGEVLRAAKVATMVTTTGTTARTTFPRIEAVPLAAYNGWRMAVQRGAAILAYTLSAKNEDEKAQELGVSKQKGKAPKLIGPAVLTDPEKTGRITYDGTTKAQTIEAAAREAKSLLGWPEDRRDREGGNGNALISSERATLFGAKSIILRNLLARDEAGADLGVKAPEQWPEHIRDFVAEICDLAVAAGFQVDNKDDAREVKYQRAA